MATVVRDLNAQLKTCPYNRAHKVKASKFQAHVTNCANQNALVALHQCPFNATHRLTDDEYKEHLLSCADNRQFMRNQVLHTKTDKTEPKEDEEDYRMKGKDIWDDQYMDETTSKNYDVLRRDESVTAEWLFNRRFGGRENMTFTDTLYVQRMSNEERKKYQTMCVQKIKERIDSGDRDVSQTADQNQNLTEQQSDECVEAMEAMGPELQVIEIRPPTIQNPFAIGVNIQTTEIDAQSFERYGAGIGRGTRSISSRGVPRKGYYH